MKYLFIGFGGALGALVRYGISKWISGKWNNGFPVATFLVNVAGAFLLGFLTTFFVQTEVSTFFRSAISTGFLGALTTYSTFSFEFITLYHAGNRFTAIVYFSMSLALGFLAAYGGIALGRW